MYVWCKVLFIRLKHFGHIVLAAVSHGVHHSVYLTTFFDLCHRNASIGALDKKIKTTQDQENKSTGHWGPNGSIRNTCSYFIRNIYICIRGGLKFSIVLLGYWYGYNVSQIPVEATVISTSNPRLVQYFNRKMEGY
jgi:hypothetical protein